MPTIERKYNMYYMRNQKGDLYAINESNGEFTKNGAHAYAPSYYAKFYGAVKNCATHPAKQELLHRLVSYEPDFEKFTVRFGDYLKEVATDEAVKLTTIKAEWKKFLEACNFAKSNGIRLTDALQVIALDFLKKLFDEEAYSKLARMREFSWLYKVYTLYGEAPYRDLARQYKKDLAEEKAYNEFKGMFIERFGELRNEMATKCFAFNEATINFPWRNCAVDSLIYNLDKIKTIYDWEKEYNIVSFGRTIEERYDDCYAKMRNMQEKEASERFGRNQVEHNLEYENEEYKIYVPTDYASCIKIGRVFNNCAGGHEWNHFLSNGIRYLVVIIEKATNKMKVCCDIGREDLAIRQYLTMANRVVENNSLLQFKEEYQKYLYSLR